MTAKMITAEQIAVLDPLVASENERIAPFLIGFLHTRRTGAPSFSTAFKDRRCRMPRTTTCETAGQLRTS